MGKSISYDSYLNKKLKNSTYAEGYLDAALADDDPGVFTLALKRVAKARGIGMVRLAEKSGLNRESLYKTLSKKGNPALATARKIAGAVGFELGVRNMTQTQDMKVSTATQRLVPTGARSGIGTVATKYAAAKKKTAAMKKKVDKVKRKK